MFKENSEFKRDRVWLQQVISLQTKWAFIMICSSEGATVKGFQALGQGLKRLSFLENVKLNLPK